VAKALKIGVIGAGARGEAFARALYEGIPGANLFGVCDIDDDRLEKFCNYCEIKDARRFTDPKEFLNSKGMDAVIITVPDWAHADVACEALAAGKHIYLEKPLANTMENCYRIADSARKSDAVTFLGFSMRPMKAFRKLKELVDRGALGEVFHISAMEQMGVAHGASFMRRWHRRISRSGGFLNAKCSHDMDMMQWIVGHEHRVVRLASFGGVNFFNAGHAPAGHGTHCSNCPADIKQKCRYVDRAGFFFPVWAKEPIYKTKEADIYGNDLCAYTEDKDIVDNQTVIMEWDNGVRGDFNLTPFQFRGWREMRIWGEHGVAQFSPDAGGESVRLTDSDTGDTTGFRFGERITWHGGEGHSMLSRFLKAIETRRTDSGIAEGIAATLLAVKAEESRLSGKAVEIKPEEYWPFK
jgi:predicted dehydrogenase